MREYVPREEQGQRWSPAGQPWLLERWASLEGRGWVPAPLLASLESDGFYKCVCKKERCGTRSILTCVCYLWSDLQTEESAAVCTLCNYYTVVTEIWTMLLGECCYLNRVHGNSCILEPCDVGSPCVQYNNYTDSTYLIERRKGESSTVSAVLYWHTQVNQVSLDSASPINSFYHIL